MPSPQKPTDASNPAADRLIGSVLEQRYRIDSYVARGGMSTVYRGVDLRLDRPVAIKVMTAQYAADPTFLARFEREARAAAKLDNPHVVGVYDQGRDGDDVFLVMELVDGGTLRDLLRSDGQLSVRVALSILEPILDALAAAHEAGLIHRDVKPENVLISERGEVKVADFGLVRAVSSATLATGDVILGTVAYLSPEQVETGASDERSDVYCAGIVAYEMLTGAPPFDGDSPLSIAYQHVHNDVPPIGERAPGVSAHIAAVIDAATSRDPLDRPTDAGDMLRALRTARSTTGLALTAVPAVAATAPARHRSSSGSTGQQATRNLGDTRIAQGLTRAEPRGKSRLDGSRHGRPAGPHRSHRGRRLAITLTVVVVLAAAAAIGGWWLADRWTSAPAVLNMPQSAAVAAVTKAGLVPTRTTRFDNTVPSGHVAAMHPEPESTQRPGQTVTLVISGGRPVVPEVTVGATAKDAAATIRKAGLTPVTRENANTYSKTIPQGGLLRTEPPAGTKQRVGADVVLVLSRGPRPEVVPGVAGKSAEDAQNKLLVAGFEIGPVRTVFDPSVPPGTVVGTDPAQGETEPRGSTISLVLAVSKSVPDVLPGTVVDAVAALDEAGFDVTVGAPVFDATVPGGQVVRLEPPIGSRIDPQDPAVTVIGSNAVSVPPVTGMTVSNATDALDELGLGADVRSLLGSGRSLVTSQHPDPGVLVEPGSVVQLDAWP